MEPSPLLAGTSVTDITPPLEVGLLTSSVHGLYEPFQSVRLPLKARVLVLGTEQDLVAVVSLDLLALNDYARSVDGSSSKRGCRTSSRRTGSSSPARIRITGRNRWLYRASTLRRCINNGWQPGSSRSNGLSWRQLWRRGLPCVGGGCHAGRLFHAAPHPNAGRSDNV